MANRTITSLPPASGLSGAEMMPVDQTDGLGNIGTFKASIDQITALVQGAINNPQLVHTFMGGPTAGVPAVPTFRILVTSDLPTPWSLAPTGTGVPVLQDAPTINNPALVNPTGITKANVGLGNVDNTSDATKNAAVAVLTNKTINADNNNIQNIDDNEIRVGANIDAAKIGTGVVSTVEFNYLDGVTSPIQGQINGAGGPGLIPIKPLTPSADTVPYYTGTVTAALATFTSAGRDLVGASTVAVQRSILQVNNVDNTSDATKNAAAAALTNKTINADLNTITNIDDNEIKPAAGIQATKIGTGVVDNTEFAYLDGATSNIQGQINAIVASGAGGPGIVPIAPLTPSADTFPYYTGATTGAKAALTATARTLLDDPDTTTMRTTLGLGTAAVEATGTVGHTLPFTDGANVWTGTNNLFSSSVVSAIPVAVQSTEAGALPGPLFDINRNSASPAAADGIGAIRFLGNSSTAVSRSYGQINCTIISPTNAAEIGNLTFYTVVSGSLGPRLQLASGAVVGTPTGGDKGLDTLNVGTLYENGTALTAKYGQLAVTNTWSAQQTFTSNQLLLAWNDPGAGGGPDLTLLRDSSSPAAGDVLGRVNWFARDSANNQQFVNLIQAIYLDPTDGSEDTKFQFVTTVAGTLASRLELGQGLWTVNAAGADKGLDTINATTLYEGGVAIVNRYGNSAGNIARRNGGLEIWQRGGGTPTFAQAASSTGYTADGWYLNTTANQASVVTRVAGIVNGSQWAANVSRNAGQTGVGVMYFAYPLDTDELYPILGQFVRLSLTLKAGANWSPASGTFGISLQLGTGTPVKYSAGYTSNTQAINSAANLTTTATRYQFASAAIVPIATRQAEILFFWTPVGTAGADDSFTIDDVQLEVVSDASQQSSPFQRLVFQEQLTLCQRHYFKTFRYNVPPATGAGGSTGQLTGGTNVTGTGLRAVNGDCRFPVIMRTNATITTYNVVNANSEARDMTAGNDCSATTLISTNNTHNANFSATGATGGALGDRWELHLTADAGI